MLRKHMAACLVASALAVVPALAQTTGPGSAGGGGAGGTAGPGPAPQPGAAVGAGGTAGPAPTAPTAQPSGAGGSAAGKPGGAGAPGNFIDRQQPGQLLSSRLIGTRVVGPNNERIGDVNDVLLDRNGQAVAIVIGVGGFLGIGEKDVAVSFRQVELTPQGQGGGAGGDTGRTAGGGTGTGTGGPAGTGDAAAGGAGAGTGAAGGSAGQPDQIMIRMSKQDLQNAPTFARAGDTGGGGAGGTDAGGTTRPSGAGGGTGAGGGGAGVGGTPGPSPK
jgi:hypothetical protein